MNIKLEPGDYFSTTDGGYGMVLPDGEAIIIRGEGGRAGYRVEKSPIPDSILPRQIPPAEVTFALEVTATATGMLP